MSANKKILYGGAIGWVLVGAIAFKYGWYGFTGVSVAAAIGWTLYGMVVR